MKINDYEKWVINLGLCVLKNEVIEIIVRNKNKPDKQSKELVSGNQKLLCKIEVLQKKLRKK
jgi:hypothetical protein